MQRLNADMTPLWLEPLTRWEQFHNIKDSVYSQSGNTLVSGLSESSKCHIAAALLYPLEQSCLYITYNDVQARSIYEDLMFFFPGRVMLFPPRDAFFYAAAAHSNEVTAQRLKVLEAFTLNAGVIVVASSDALLAIQSPAHVFKESLLTIKVGDVLPLPMMAEKLVGMGYERVDAVEGGGQFCIRGGIVDLFTMISDKPCRIELFDDQVDSIREFEPFSQRSTEKLEQVVLSPARELILTQQAMNRAKKKIAYCFEKFGLDAKATGEAKIYTRSQEKMAKIIDALDHSAHSHTMDSYFNFFYPERPSAIEYISDSALIVLDDPTRIAESCESYCRDFNEHFKDLLSQGEVLPEQSQIVLDHTDLLRNMADKRQLFFKVLPVSRSAPAKQQTYYIKSKGIPSYQGNLFMLAGDLGSWKNKEYSVAVVLSSSVRAKGFVVSLKDIGIEAVFKDSYEGCLTPGQIVVLSGNIARGIEYPDARFIIITEQDIYGSSKKKARFKKATKKLNPFTDYKIGDYVVHENHGIGRYIGMETLTVDARKRDYLNIKYAGTDRLYVPADQMELIQPYAVFDDAPPKLSKLGGAEWQRTRARVKESVQKLAVDLVQLYAVRHTAKGHRYSPDTEWQRQFELSFPYEETIDQLQAVDEIKRDMESNMVMDRLLCGDVGYGKTEVAIRAAFKAVMEGKQVAVLAPTTILAQQHYSTFVKRFESFPFAIDVLSRFKTPAEQKTTLKTLKAGSLDIIIGTHRLLGKDVRFGDLGLLIIDEEQRFGVSHKEIIKNIKKNVDVLTLTATPIPRTLHMSLAGIRDISTIETPPEGRYPVQTYVVEYDEPMIRDAILKEISRGGQLYFVYNRVKSIEFMAEKLREMIPGLRLAIAHGQMGENTLEDVMIGFYQHHYDLLLCSTIIENGLDIPNVNTIIVYDCDHFGLSQLYQLRGRVGRSNRRAYAYFTYKKDKALSEQAEKRLYTIKEFTEFGAGFKIAMRDLEIRGAGNILGGEQHGHMMAVGYDMYYRFLKEAVKELKGENDEIVAEIAIDIKVDAHISREYIPDQGQRIGIYKRIATIDCAEDKNDVEEELVDRFGDLPQAVNNLIEIAYIKALGRSLRITEIAHQDKAVKIRLLDINTISPRKIMAIINENRNKLEYLSSQPPIILLKLKDKLPQTALEQVKDLLKKMLGLQSEKESALKA